MAKQVVVHVWCDLCSATELEADLEESRTPGRTTLPIHLGVGKAKTLDLCEAHEKELLEPLREALAHSGVVTDTAATSGPRTATSSSKASSSKARVGEDRPLHCRVPDCTLGPYGHVQSLRTHVRSYHGLTLTEMRTRYGPEYVPPGDRPSEESTELDQGPALWEDEEDDSQWACGVGDCPKVYRPGEYRRPAQALGVHRANAHGIRSTKEKAKKARAKAAEAAEEVPEAV